MNAYQFNVEEIRRAWSRFIEPGQVTELRVLHATIAGDRRPGTYSGYFNDVDAFCDALAPITAASAVYYVPNPVDPALLARAYNRARMVGKEPLTGDKDIIRRRWLLVDADPVRATGVSATDDEKRAARDVITACDYELWEQGFPPGIFCDSGNGEHLLVPINKPADDKFCELVLKWLAKRCNTPWATVDISVHNAARIWKLPGTMACKGDHCPEIGRVWRMASIRQELNGDTNHARM